MAELLDHGQQHQPLLSSRGSGRGSGRSGTSGSVTAASADLGSVEVFVSADGSFFFFFLILFGLGCCGCGSGGFPPERIRFGFVVMSSDAAPGRTRILDWASALVCVAPHSEPAQVRGSWTGVFWGFFSIKIGLLLHRTLSVMSADVVRLTCQGLTCRQQDTGEEPGGAGGVSSRETTC